MSKSAFGACCLSQRPRPLARRLECVLASSKQAVLDESKRQGGEDLPQDPFLKKAVGLPF